MQSVCRWEVGNHQGRQKTSLNKRSELVSKCRHENRYYQCNFPPPISWSLYLTCLSTNMSLNMTNIVSSEPHISFYYHLSSPVIFCQSRITPLCFFPSFSLCFISHSSFPLFFFSQFFSQCFLGNPSSHPLTPVSTAPSPPIPIYPRSCVVCFVYLPEDQKKIKCLLNLVGRKAATAVVTNFLPIVGISSCVWVQFFLLMWSLGTTTANCQDLPFPRAHLYLPTWFGSPSSTPRDS